eukprot:NODE_5286_length_961_cov_70.269690_g5071_i0.p1 GENE.NODE_5286_length_961_cov_70.269690_g5071_i0~~NODE_5286_length_961_cov_70.269690_g5071_i0.p1  ORF type:complete len:256 (-),score=69.76 NODE_5286_length_961_cov_70.269690_g5071_i0:120-887(-)
MPLIKIGAENWLLEADAQGRLKFACQANFGPGYTLYEPTQKVRIPSDAQGNASVVADGSYFLKEVDATAFLKKGRGSGGVKAAGPKKVTAMMLFGKAVTKKSGESRPLMELGRLWSALTDDQKAKWKVKAAKENEQAALDFENGPAESADAEPKPAAVAAPVKAVPKRSASPAPTAETNAAKKRKVATADEAPAPKSKSKPKAAAKQASPAPSPSSSPALSPAAKAPKAKKAAPAPAPPVQVADDNSSDFSDLDG